MCGICCFIGYKDGFDMSFQGLKLLLNRGYDACGCAGISDNGKLIVYKYASTIDKSAIDLLELHKQDFETCKTIINHSRWSTTGAKTDINAHPHVDYKN